LYGLPWDKSHDICMGYLETSPMTLVWVTLRQVPWHLYGLPWDKSHDICMGYLETSPMTFVWVTLRQAPWHLYGLPWDKSHDICMGYLETSPMTFVWVTLRQVPWHLWGLKSKLAYSFVVQTVWTVETEVSTSAVLTSGESHRTLSIVVKIVKGQTNIFVRIPTFGMSPGLTVL
jgi:hypothetical protein